MSIFAVLDDPNIDHNLLIKVMGCPSFNKNNIDSVVLTRNTLDKEGEYLINLLEEKSISLFLSHDTGQFANGTMNTIDLQWLTETVQKYPSINGIRIKSFIDNIINIPTVLKQQITYCRLFGAFSKIPVLDIEFPSDVLNKGEVEYHFSSAAKIMIDEMDTGVFLRLSMPTQYNLYPELAKSINVVRLMANEQNYSRGVAVRKLSQSLLMSCSFSSLILDNLSADMDTELINKGLQNNIDEYLSAVNNNHELYKELLLSPEQEPDSQKTVDNKVET